MEQKLKVDDKVIIRGNEFTICTDTIKNKKYYFTSSGTRGVLQLLGINFDDEYKLANQFSRVPKECVEQNPLRATSLPKLQKFINHVIERSANIPESEEEKERRIRKERYKRVDALYEKYSSRNNYRCVSPFEMIADLMEANEQLVKRIEELEEKVEKQIETLKRHLE